MISSVQRLNANYFGRYIEDAIRAIPKEELEEAERKGEPAALIIGSRQYLQQIATRLTDVGLKIDRGREKTPRLERSQGLEILAESPESNLGWRVILESETAAVRARFIRAAASSSSPLTRALSAEFIAHVLEEARKWVAERQAKPEAAAVGATGGPWIKLTSFEGAKGLSAQHVFIVGLHADELPHDTNNVADLEVCKFLVGLTRTKKKCSVLITKQFAGKPKSPSPFLQWIRRERYEVTKISAASWARIPRDMGRETRPPR